MARNAKKLGKLLAQTHALLVPLDESLYVWLIDRAKRFKRNGTAGPLESVLSQILRNELRDQSYQMLKARGEAIRTTAVWLREDLSYLFRLLLVNLIEQPDETIDSWIEQCVPSSSEKRNGRIQVGSLFGPPPRAIPLNANAMQADTQMREVRVQIDGTVFETLQEEASKLGVSNETLARHIFQNYRDNEDLREVDRGLMVANAMISRVVDDCLDLVERVLVETHPTDADDIRKRLDKLRNTK